VLEIDPVQLGSSLSMIPKGKRTPTRSLRLASGWRNQAACYGCCSNGGATESDSDPLAG